METATAKQTEYVNEMISEASELISAVSKKIDDPENYRTYDNLSKLKKLIKLSNTSGIEIKSENIGVIGDKMKYADMMKYKIYASMYISNLQTALVSFKKNAAFENLI